MKMDGTITLITGPMFSGKTSELLKRVNKYIISGKRCIIIKHFSDTRYTNIDKIITHDKYSIKCDIVISSTLYDVEDKVNKYDVIGIDEGQFFKNISEFADKMANNSKIILVSALNGDYKQRVFFNIINLISKVSNIVYLTAICKNCFSKASFTKRTSTDDDIEVVGDINKYKPVCRRCL